MSKTPVTVYLDFRTARAIKASADALGVSQSRWLSECAQAQLASDQPAKPDLRKCGAAGSEART